MKINNNQFEMIKREKVKCKDCIHCVNNPRTIRQYSIYWCGMYKKDIENNNAEHRCKYFVNENDLPF